MWHVLSDVLDCYPHIVHGLFMPFCRFCSFAILVARAQFGV